MNNIKMNVIGTQVVCTVMLNGQIFGQVMPSREEALAFYYKEASHLDSLGILHPESGIIN